jgi:hypothetical protein
MPEISRALFLVHGAATEPAKVIVPLDRVQRQLGIGDHFETEGEAWDWLERDVKAQGRLVAGEIERLRKQLALAEKEAGNALIRAKAIDDGRTRGDTHER